jgi:hypothetical protein
MQRFSTWARYIFTAILVPILIPVATHFIEEQPRETANAVLKFLFDLSEQTWLRITALSLGCFVAGLWVQWLLQKLDRSRVDERKALGTEMVNLGDKLSVLTDPMYPARPQIMSCFTTAKKLGIWEPGQRVSKIRADNLIMEYPMRQAITDYLMDVGTMLEDGHFKEAKQHAKSRKASFDKAYSHMAQIDKIRGE